MKDTEDACGAGSELEIGILSDIHGDRPRAFVPRKSRFWRGRYGVQVEARVCKDCGTIDFVADVDELHGLLKSTS